MKTVFITVLQPFISRNILNTGVLEEFLERDTRVVLFVESEKYDYYKSVYTDSRVVVESFDAKVSLGTLDRVLKGLAFIMTDTINKRLHRRIELVRTGNRTRYYLTALFTKLFGNSNIMRKLFRVVDKHLNSTSVFDSYFKRYSPDVVFCPNVFGEGDVLLLKNAQKCGIRDVGMVLSWDNNTSKGLMRVVPTVLLVQNEVIASESEKIQGASSKRIIVTGIPHYDYYKEYKPVSRDELFKKEKLDTRKKFVFISPSGNHFIDTDWQLFEILKQAYNSGKIKGEVQFMISIHPTNPLEFKQFEPDENFVIRNWGVSLEGVRRKSREFARKELDDLIDIISHADVVINAVSSMAIDAAVLDKPIITFGFDGWEKNVPYTRSVERYLELENMRGLLETDGAPVAKTQEELVGLLNQYLADPSVGREDRERLVSRQCWKVDGKSKERIVDAVLGNKT